jgi:endoglucanase
MDEVGFVVSAADKNGLLRFQTIGLAPNILLAKTVSIGPNKIPGVIGCKPAHMTKEEERKKPASIDSLFIDIGVNSREEALKLVGIGDYAAFATEFRERDGIFFGKAFDNRVGCYILIKLINTLDIPAYYAFTTQEEVGLRGAKIVAHRIDPDIALAVDTTASGEWPVDKDVPTYPIIGKGPVISVADRSIICDRDLVELIEKTARAAGIQYQYKRPMIGGTDAGTIHLTRSGVRSAVIQVPARYIHSPMSIMHKDDVEQAFNLISRVIQNIHEEASRWN